MLCYFIWGLQLTCLFVRGFHKQFLCDFFYSKLNLVKDLLSELNSCIPLHFFLTVLYKWRGKLKYIKTLKVCTYIYEILITNWDITNVLYNNSGSTKSCNARKVEKSSLHFRVHGFLYRSVGSFWPRVFMVSSIS